MQRRIVTAIVAIAAGMLIVGCQSQPSNPLSSSISSPESSEDLSPTPSPMVSPSSNVSASNNALADVTDVSTFGESGNYTFSVTIESPDTGCNQYAAWWEVISEDGELLYRRILFHSHVDEQPFTRPGGPVPIQADQVVIVRSFMKPQGYGGKAFQGSVTAGFSPVDLPADFAAEVANQGPQASCEF